MNQTTFLDWVYMAQQRPSGAPEWPLIHDGFNLKTRKEFMEGEIDGTNLVFFERPEDFRYSMKSLPVRGSHSTQVITRCDGTEMLISGNVGRYNRPDNIWNYQLDDTVAIANQIMQAQGLPVFTPGEMFMKPTMSERDRENGVPPWAYTGAVFREMHVTRNYATGGDAIAKEYMRFIQGQRSARISKGVFGHESVVFGELARRGKPLHKAIVCYRKGPEMLAHAKGKENKERILKSPEYQLAMDTGLVRVECKWGSHYLRDRGLRYLGGITMAKIISLFERETAFLLDAEPDRAARVVADMPPKLRSAALHWIRGDDLRQLFSRATFFRHVKALRDYGIDASEPRNISGRPNGEEALQRMLDALPAFNLREMAAPEWYGLPEVERRAA